MEKESIMVKDINFSANDYQGYLWFSDSAKPKVFDCEQVDASDFDGINPFIIEGYLYSVSLHVSYSIKYVDGKTIVNKYTLNDDYFKNRTTKMFYPNRMGNRMFKFMDVWEPVADPLCEGMEVLQPKVKVFIGFENLKEKEN